MLSICIDRSISSLCPRLHIVFFFFFNDTATTEIYTLSLHDALPIYLPRRPGRVRGGPRTREARANRARSEEHTSELQSRRDLVCRLLLEKKKKLHLTCPFNQYLNIRYHNPDGAIDRRNFRFDSYLFR